MWCSKIRFVRWNNINNVSFEFMECDLLLEGEIGKVWFGMRTKTFRSWLMHCPLNKGGIGYTGIAHGDKTWIYCKLTRKKHVFWNVNNAGLPRNFVVSVEIELWVNGFWGLLWIAGELRNMAFCFLKVTKYRRRKYRR